MPSTQAKLQQAMTLHQTGQLAQAQQLYEVILQAEPSHFDALHYAGILASQTKDHRKALELIGKAIALNPASAEAYSNQGVILQEIKEWDAALVSYDKAIALKPDFVEAFYNRGNVLMKLGRLDAALASYGRTIALKPAYAQAHYNRGNVFLKLKKWDAALADYNAAIALRPDYGEAYSNRGTVLMELKAWDEALASYDKAIALKPDNAEAYGNRSNALLKLKRWDEALASCDHAIALMPDDAENYSNRGIILKELKSWDAALKSCDRAIALNPGCAEAFYNRAGIASELGQMDAVLASYDKAIALKPDYAEAYSNRSNVLTELGQMDAALASYDKAIALKPDYAEAHYNKSLALLLLGDFARGWEEYEWRWKMDIFPQRNFTQPLWLGKESLAGETILLYAEQGFGDAIQFCRYIPMVAALGARVILMVHAPLIPLLAGFDGVAQLIADGEAPPPFDYHCPLMSLPLAFKTRLRNLQAAPRYLFAAADKTVLWQAKLGAKIKPRIGIVWRGRAEHKNDHSRSMALEKLIAHLPEGFQYVSLQKEKTDADKKTLGSHPQILQFSDELKDFSDTAALCELMDVVISVDTSVAHLSAALGKPTWILITANPDWRWLLGRDDSPWYPTARLFRQSKPGDWESVMTKVKAELETFSLHRQTGHS